MSKSPSWRKLQGSHHLANILADGAVATMGDGSEVSTTVASPTISHISVPLTISRYGLIAKAYQIDKQSFHNLMFDTQPRPADPRSSVLHPS